MFYITIPIATNLPAYATDLNMSGFVSSIISIALPVAGIATLAYLVWGGISYITAGGDKGKVEEAKNKITGAIIGLIIVVASWSIFAFINNSLNLGLIGSEENQISAPSGFKIIDFGSLVSNAIGIALILAAVVAFLYLIWGGIQYITSGGDKGKVEEARNRITSAIVGLAIVACSWAIFLIVNQMLGLDITVGGGGGGGGGGTISCSRGQCVASSRCQPGVTGSVGSDIYCQNSLYMNAQFGDCGSGFVCCDCVVK